MNAQLIVTAIIGVVIAVTILSSLGNTIQLQTTGQTTACGTVISASYNESRCALENASATGKTMYSLIELLYPIMGVLFMVGVGFAVSRRG